MLIDSFGVALKKFNFIDDDLPRFFLQNNFEQYTRYSEIKGINFRNSLFGID